MNILFHFFKHHLNDSRKLIEKYFFKNIPEQDILKILKKIGNNHLDSYIGKLTTEEIIKDIKIKNYNILYKNEEFFIIEIKDTSLWIIKKIYKYDKIYLHLHPAKERISKFSIRLHANTYKTLLFTYWIFLKNRTSYESSENEIFHLSRKKLELEPFDFSKSKIPILFHQYFKN